MARRIQLQGIVQDALAAFISRNNDLNGYWALGQLRNWIEGEGAGALDIPIVGEGLAEIKTEISPISQRFAARLLVLMKSKNLPSEWVQDARFTVKLAAFDRLDCSFRVVSDLGRSFKSSRVLLVRGHDPRRELRRRSAATAARP
ncbi:MAG: hypothetical protein ABGX10_02725 [Paracoccus sp. (in: a-proteobacteria)]|uniref:hypothetical protein n=1 Tax=Paracoccus sp. TaxID=267 RepID=UPI00324209F1